MCLKSPSYSDNAAYWIGATDMNNEGFFKWTDSSPFTYSSKFPQIRSMDLNIITLNA